MVAMQAEDFGRGPRKLEKRFLVTSDERRDLDDFCHRLRRETSLSLSTSHVVRAAVKVAQRHPNRIIRLITESDLKRPANGDEQSTVEFENLLADIIARSLADD